MSRSTYLRNQLLDAGIRNLTEFGYPGVTRENILSDDVFKRFFRSMLEESLPQAREALMQQEIKKLLDETM